MCGIFGAIGRDLPPSALERVFATLHHRGPDGKGAFTDPSVQLTLAHTRLAVIDLVTGEQPLYSADGNIVLVANGEIYDFERIRSILEAKGRRFKTRSDSELIIALYEEYGLDCFEQLRGEFAFLLYDKAKRLLVAARDRFGIKPLFLAAFPDGLVFASEMKAIFASGLVRPKLDAAALDPLLSQDPDNARFPFEGIKQVPPGSYVAVNLSDGTTSTKRYWSPELPAEIARPVTEPADEARASAARTVLSELEGAVRLRLRADVPVGLYLSGGIDSAFVGALMERNLTSKLHSFSIAFEGSDRNEQHFARQAADFLGTEHHELTVTKEMLWDNLKDCVWFSELPFVTLAPVGKFLLSREARKSVTVVLTGEGADEVFLGYRSYFSNAIRDTRDPSRRRKSASTGLRRLKVSGLAAALVSKLSLLIFHKAQRSTIEAARSIDATRPTSSKPIINAVQEARLAGMPLDILCYLGDREEMAHSLEARLPFLDHKLYDAARSIPVDFKMRDGLEKAVLRDAAIGILPEDLRLRRKSGFMLTSEAVDFFGSDRRLAEQFQALLAKETFESARIFSHRSYLLARLLATIPPWLAAFRRLRRNANKVIMYMMQVHMLHEMFVDRPRWESTAPEPGTTPPIEPVAALG